MNLLFFVGPKSVNLCCVWSADLSNCDQEGVARSKILSFWSHLVLGGDSAGIDNSVGSAR